MRTPATGGKQQCHEIIEKMIAQETENIMKTILCYGDSNTYGFDPKTGLRYPEDIRWTGRLQKLLGHEYRVIEEGCNGRTTVFTDPIEGWKSGEPYLRPCLNTHKPVDIVIMMLGSNDLKKIFGASSEEIAAGAERLVKIIKEFTPEKQGFIPKIILVSPPVIGDDIEKGPFGCSFDHDAVSRSEQFAELYRKVAERNDCIFFNAADHVVSSKTDSLHLDGEAHKKLASALAHVIKEIS